MTRQPSQHLGMLVRGVIVEHGMDQFAGWHVALDGIEETNEFAMSVALHASADHPSVEHAERGEQGGRAVPLVIVRHSLTTPRLDRQPRLAAVERLDLALFVEREHHGVGRWIDVKADNIGQLGGKARIARTLEGADAVGLQLVHLPDALHRAQRDADRLGHGAASPMGRLVRRRGAGGHLVPQNSFGRWGALDNNAPSLTAQPSGESMLTRQNEARDPAAPAADSARLFK